jgi:hypothetical protein
MFYFFAWMSNPDLLPRMKTVTFFSEIAGRSSFGFGPPPAKSPLSSPPAGVDICLLIHLDHYVDWMPQTTSSFTSGVSGLPSSSSDSAPGRSFPFFRRFSWTTGVANGQAGASIAHARPMPPAHGRGPQRDEDIEDERQDRSRYDRWRNINARGCPADDLGYRGTQGARHRTRSSCGVAPGGHRRAASSDDTITSPPHGRVLSCSPVRIQTRHPPSQ